MSAAGAQWVVLGAGSILPRAGHGCAGHALVPDADGPVTLLDCGPGSLRMLGACGIELARVARVVLTHFHPDHCLDLLALAFARRNPSFDAPPLELVGPRGLGAWLQAAVGAFGRWVAFEDARVVEAEPTDAPSTLALDGLRLASVGTRHTPDSLAWRAELPGGARVAYSGDSGEQPALAELARGADLFVCECSFPEEEAVPHHLTPAGAGRLAAAAGCARLLLTHFYPSMDPARAAREAAAVFGGAVETARDGSRHALFQRRTPDPGPTSAR